MISKRKLIAITSLAALLLGNVGAFVHVGHHQVPSHASGVEQSDSSCSCCSKTRSCEPQSEGQSSEQGHDSGSCSICQSFYTSRAGVSHAAPAMINCGNTVEFLPICTTPAPISIVIAGFDSRGPPAA